MNDTDEFAVVYRAQNEGLVALAQSVLIGEKIPYALRNHQIMDLFAVGRLGMNVLIGPVDVLVPARYAEPAHGLLRDLPSTEPGPAWSPAVRNASFYLFVLLPAMFSVALQIRFFME